MLVLDTQTNGAQMRSEDLLKNIEGAQAGAPHAMRNLLFATRFKVLKSKRMIFNNITGTWDGTNIELRGQSQHFNWDINNLNLLVNFDAGTTSSIANVIDNSLHIIAYQNNEAPTPTINYASRIRFVG